MIINNRQKNIGCTFRFDRVKLNNLKILERKYKGVQWLSGRVLDSRPKGPGFEPHWRHCVGSLSKTY